LFSTLDPTTRRLHLPGGETVLASDTVGFVRRLPHQLVESFRSTLEEVVDADLLLHVVDAASPVAEEQIAAVRGVLAEIGAGQVPELLVANQIDRAEADAVKALLAAYPGAVAVSAVTGRGVPELLDRITARLRELSPVVELAIPYARSDILAALHRDGEVLVEVHAADEARVRARLSERDRARYAAFALGSDGTRPERPE
jgi:GTP-binding protein HflX